MKIFVKVKPAARKNKVKKVGETEYEVSVSAPPADGKANKAVIAILAEYFGVTKSCIEIVSGRSAKHKLFEIRDAPS